MAPTRKVFTARPAVTVVIGLVALALAGGLAIVYLRDNDSPKATGETVAPTPSAAADLPGTGWGPVAVVTTGRAAEGASPLAFSSPPVRECESLRSFERKLADLDAGFVSGMSRTVERRDGDRLLARMAQTVGVFRDETGLDAALGDLQTVLSSPSFADCLRRAAELSGSMPEVATVPVAVQAPNGGPGAAVRFRVAPGEGGEMVEHVFWWRDGRALSAVVLSTWDSTTDVDGLVKAAQAVAAPLGR